MEKCYEYFKCKKKDCPAFDENQNCWETENTLCNDPSVEVIVKYNKNKCEYCQYYKRIVSNH